MNGFSDKVKQKLGYYVYALADPRDNKIFYIGKGINNRIFQHEEKLDNSNKSNRIKEILSSGNKIKKTNYIIWPFGKRGIRCRIGFDKYNELH